MNFIFLITSLSIAWLNLFKATGAVCNLLTSKPSTFVFKSFKMVEILTNLVMSNLSSSAFKARKSFLAAKSDVSTPLAWSNSF